MAGTPMQSIVDWREFREFAAADLSRSFVLTWALESETLVIEIDLYLTPEHAFYENPRPSENACIRPAVIEFPYCERIESDKIPVDTDPQKMTSKLGHGSIEGLSRLADGRYQVRGEFGVVVLDAERPILRLRGP
jgi:hypothetical protein